MTSKCRLKMRRICGPMISIHDPRHPVWAAIRWFSLLTVLGLVLWTNASVFDETEIRTIVEIGVVVGGWEFVSNFKTWRKAIMEGDMERDS
jgi:hypothetical protein